MVSEHRQASAIELNAMAASDAMAWLTGTAKPRPGDKALPRIAHLEARIAEHVAGPKAQTLDGEGVSGGGMSDPTYAASQRRADPATADLAAMRTLARRIRIDAIVLERLGRRYLTTTVTAPDQPGEEGCAWCARVDAWSPVHCRTDGARWLEAPLADQTPVCTACYRRLRDTNAVPGNADLAVYHRTGKWPKQRVAA